MADIEELIERMRLLKDGVLVEASTNPGRVDALVQKAATALSAQQREIAELREALNGYRAAVSYISADSWDGCSDCIHILKAARSRDDQWDWAGDPDRIARELRRLRQYYGLNKQESRPQAALNTPSQEGEKR